MNFEPTNILLVEDEEAHAELTKRAILDASIDRIRYVDEDMKIIWANKTVSFELGIPPKDIIGQFCYKLCFGLDAPCEGCPTMRARETRQIGTGRDVLSRKGWDKKGKVLGRL